ncbi:MAG: SufD family Fe-S cluster assembly protein [Eubacterium sp.]|nr:SufD family Fe-S cluster assembly protein [Eubacterium sp.]
MSEIAINKLPVPTWTWLKVNEYTVAVPDKFEKAEGLVDTMPEEVKVGKVDFTSVCLGDVELGAGEEFRRISHAAKTGGASYTVPAGVKVEEPIRISYDLGNDSSEVGKLSRTAIVLGEDSELTVVMTFKGCPKFGANDIRIKAAKTAKLTLVEIFDFEDGANFVDSIGGRYLEKGGLKLIQIKNGKGSVALSCCADLDGYKSTLDIDTGYLVTGEDKLDINYVARHRGAKTDTKISVSGVLRDKADKTFRGTIDFIKGCKTATGDEREDVLLMDEGVHNNTVPLILCAEEDVEGAHGASIGKISEEILTYFASRGIPEAEVTELMAKSRIDAVAGRIPDDKTRELFLASKEEAIEIAEKHMGEN